MHSLYLHFPSPPNSPKSSPFHISKNKPAHLATIYICQSQIGSLRKDLCSPSKNSVGVCTILSASSHLRFFSLKLSVKVIKVDGLSFSQFMTAHCNIIVCFLLHKYILISMVALLHVTRDWISNSPPCILVLPTPIRRDNIVCAPFREG